MGATIGGSESRVPEWQDAKTTNSQQFNQKSSRSEKVDRTALIAIGSADTTVRRAKMLLSSREFKESTKGNSDKVGLAISTRFWSKLAYRISPLL